MSWCFAKLYDFMTRSMERRGVADWRRQLLSQAEGAVVEIGAGTGVNLGYYPDSVRVVHATEPDRHMRGRLARRISELGDERIHAVEAGAESLPFGDGEADVIVATLVFCTVPDAPAGLRECYRVLRPGGRLLFLEHVRADDPKWFRWQRRLEPFQKWFAEGCCLTRPVGEWIREAGFEVESVQRERLPAAPPTMPSIRGVARKPGR